MSRVNVMDIECWALVRYILDATAFVVTSYKEGSYKELDYFINKTLPSVLDPSTAKAVAELVSRELSNADVQVIDVVTKVQQLLLSKLRCDEVSAS